MPTDSIQFSLGLNKSCRHPSYFFSAFCFKAFARSFADSKHHTSYEDNLGARCNSTMDYWRHCQREVQWHYMVAQRRLEGTAYSRRCIFSHHLEWRIIRQNSSMTPLFCVASLGTINSQ